MAYRFDCTEPSGRRRGVDRAVTSVNLGELVVFPVDTVYGVGCDAFSVEGVEALRALKGHGRDQPPPVMIAHPRTLDGICTDLGPGARALAAAFWPGPLTMVCRAQPTLDWDLGDTGGTVAVRMPLHPVALALLDRTGPMAVTGAGVPGTPSPRDLEPVKAAFGEDVAVYLDAGTLTREGASTIVDVTGDAPRVLRIGGVSFAELRDVVPDLVQ